MSLPLQAKSPVLVTNIKDGEVELVGRLHHVAVVRNRPRTLGTWRVTTESPRTADRIAQVLGGHIQQDPTADPAEILTTSSTIDILLTESTALYIGCSAMTRTPATALLKMTARSASAQQTMSCAGRRPSKDAAVGPAQRSCSDFWMTRRSGYSNL
jgi:hypothetical protein